MPVFEKPPKQTVQELIEQNSPKNFDAYNYEAQPQLFIKNKKNK
jgi:hypothetical protein